MEVLEHIGSGEGSRCIVAALLTDAPVTIGTAVGGWGLHWWRDPNIVGR